MSQQVSDLATRAALAYVEHINAKALQPLLDLFADNAKLIHPYGLFEGKDKLAEFYGGLVMLADTSLSVTSVTSEANRSVIAVTAVSPQAPGKAQYALDLFTVNEVGLIVELAIYYRSPEFQ